MSELEQSVFTVIAIMLMESDHLGSDPDSSYDHELFHQAQFSHMQNGDNIKTNLEDFWKFTNK